jgi:hypothetical protein
LEYLLPNKDVIHHRCGLGQRTHPAESDRRLKLLPPTSPYRQVIMSTVATREEIAKWRRDESQERERERLQEQIRRYKSLRKDGASCWPAILRVSRKLYEEGSRIMENTLRRSEFVAVVRCGDIEFFGRKYHVDDISIDTYGALIVDMRHISSIRIELGPHGRIRDSDVGFMFKDHVNLIAACVRQSMNLKKVVLDLMLEGYGSRLDELEQAIFWCLRPFESLRGLQSVEIRINVDGISSVHLEHFLLS